MTDLRMTNHWFSPNPVNKPVEAVVPKTNLVPHTDPILRQRMVDFGFAAPPIDPKALEQLLCDEMRRLNGLGLSANQIGLPYNVFAMATNPIGVAFNPQLVDFGEELIDMDEACLSLPGITAMVKRPRRIKVRFQTSDGETHTEKYDGMTARIFQHELDHLLGILFTDHLSRLKKEMAIKKAAKHGHKYSVNSLHD